MSMRLCHSQSEAQSDRRTRAESREERLALGCLSLAVPYREQKAHIKQKLEQQRICPGSQFLDPKVQVTSLHSSQVNFLAECGQKSFP